MCTFVEVSGMRPTVSDVQNRLARQTGAWGSGYTQDDSSMVIYRLLYRDTIGFDWLKSQVKEVAEEMNEPLQMWQLDGVEQGVFELTVKELEPRHEIDDNQSGFGDFE